ncbi:MAG TPA: L-histidine N(alpha)-methyltransferase [Frankiaceae bacterium]|nr:L-histidine N(alpha)-methyltransferase [Frankiaceae bacterium]
MTVLSRYLEVHDATEELARDVAAGLTRSPKELPPKWLYDARGSELFEDITRLPEYYPTRAEQEILQRRADEIARATRADMLVELGAGSCEKARVLLDALSRGGSCEAYVAADVSESALQASMATLTAEYPQLAVEGVVADFETHLDRLPAGRRRLVAFLGGTIGNLVPAQRHRFLAGVAAILGPDDTFLLGTDLVKDPERLVRAYDDAAGVTAAFDLNVLAVVNRELKADFDLTAFRHRSVWDPENEWIEMRLESLRDQTVRIEALDLAVRFVQGEQMRTEISAKFRRSRLEAEAGAVGLRVRDWWTDEAGDYALSLLVAQSRA